MKISPCKILITGATGFIGRSLTTRLLQDGHQIYAIHRSPNPPDFNRAVQWIFHDLTQPIDISKLPPKMDVVVHLAMSSRIRDFPENSSEVFNVHIRSTFDILHYCLHSGARKMIYGSSGGVYGYKDSEAMEEDSIHLQSDLGFYLASKGASELLVQGFSSVLSVGIARLFFVYGPGQHSDRLIPRLVQQIGSDQPVSLDGSDGVRLNPIFISDAVEALMRLIYYSDSLIVNIGGTETITLRELAQTIGQQLNKTPKFKENLTKPNSSMTGNIQRLKKILEYSPVINLKEGISTLLQSLSSS